MKISLRFLDQNREQNLHIHSWEPVSQQRWKLSKKPEGQGVFYTNASKHTLLHNNFCHLNNQAFSKLGTGEHWPPPCYTLLSGSCRGSPKPPRLWTEQPQFPQPLPIRRLVPSILSKQDQLYDSVTVESFFCSQGFLHYYIGMTVAFPLDNFRNIFLVLEFSRWKFMHLWKLPEGLWRLQTVPLLQPAFEFTLGEDLALCSLQLLMEALS